MRLIELKLENFRCYQEERSITFENFTTIVGRNDAGKSTILEALDIFFENKSPDHGDLCVHAVQKIATITCTFDKVPVELIIDSMHKTNLKEEYLLNEFGHLEIVKEYNFDLASPKLHKIYAKALHPSADNYSDLIGLTNARLKDRAKALGLDTDSINKTVNKDIRHAIWDSSPDLKTKKRLIELNSNDGKAIWDQLKKSLPVFALFKSDRPSTDQDNEAQDPLKIAVKEVIAKKEDELQKITEAISIELQGIAGLTIDKLKDLNPDIANILTPVVKNKNWDTLFSVSLTGDEDIPVNKRGSGTRRLILLSFFRAKVEQESFSEGSNVIYAIEEPETSQHPSNQLLLLRSLEELASREKCQVIITTHTPVLARRVPQETLRYISNNEIKAVPKDERDIQLLHDVASSLGVLPDHAVKIFFMVEGKHDINFLRIISSILNQKDDSIPDLGDAELNGRLIFIPLGGSNLGLWVARLRGLSISEFILMDRDEEPPKLPKYHNYQVQFNLQLDTVAWTTNKKELENYIHHDLIKNEIENYTGSGADFENVPELLAKAIHESSESPVSWDSVLADPEKLKKKEANAKHKLNSEIVKKMTPELLKQVDPQDELIGWLKQLGTALKV